MSKINPDTLKDLFLAAMTDNPSFEYISGEQPFIIKYKGQRYYIYMIKLTSAYFKSRPDTTRAQLNRRACFDEIKKSPYPFIFWDMMERMMFLYVGIIKLRRQG